MIRRGFAGAGRTRIGLSIWTRGNILRLHDEWSILGARAAPRSFVRGPRVAWVLTGGVLAGEGKLAQRYRLAIWTSVCSDRVRPCGSCSMHRLVTLMSHRGMLDPISCLLRRTTRPRSQCVQLKPEKVYYVGGFGVLTKWLPVGEYEVRGWVGAFAFPASSSCRVCAAGLVLWRDPDMSLHVDPG